jgi:chorismate-pyruvate lyase
MHAIPEMGSPVALSMLLPLHYFYANEERPLPEIEWLDGADVPEPERSLLVHERDMTSTLARFHGSPLELEVLAREVSSDYLMRMVVLRRRDNGAPVEFGAIGIRLEAFEGPIRDQIATGMAPLGGLLERHKIDFRSCPRGYFSLISDRRIGHALSEIEGVRLFGRSNELTDADGIVFADIVEVLPRAGGSSELETGA